MPSYDFEVDLQALVTAASGLAETVQLLKDVDVEDLLPSKGALGSGVVRGAVEEFSERWERGLNDLVGDVEEMAGRLGKVASTYAEFDSTGAEQTTALAGELGGLSVRGGGA